MAEYTPPTPDGLRLYLGADTIDTERAELLISIAEDVAAATVSPLPSGAEGVVLAAAARSFVNPTQSTSQTAGPFNIGQPFPGVYLTKNERRALRALAGRKGAFTVNPTPTTAMNGYRDPLTHPTLHESEVWSLNERVF